MGIVFTNTSSSYPLISSLFCKSKTLWNIFMIFVRNIEQDQMMCRIQEWQLCLYYFWHYLPLLCLTVIIHCFLVHSVGQRPFGIFLWYLVENREQDQTTCHVQEWQLCLSYFWHYLPLLCLTLIIHWFRVRSVSQRPFGIFFDTW